MKASKIRAKALRRESKAREGRRLAIWTAGAEVGRQQAAEEHLRGILALMAAEGMLQNPFEGFTPKVRWVDAVIDGEATDTTATSLEGPTE